MSVNYSSMAFEDKNIDYIASTPVGPSRCNAMSVDLSPIQDALGGNDTPRTANTTRISNEFVRIQSKVHFGFVKLGEEIDRDLDIFSTADRNLWVKILRPTSNVFSVEFTEDFLLQPGSKQSFRLTYKPNKAKVCDTETLFLTVSYDEQGGKKIRFKVCLVGFSGKSEVVPEGLPVVDGSKWEACIKNRRSEVTLKNVGNRAAFVRIVVTDSNGHPSAKSDIWVKPDQFILDALNDCQKTVTVNFLAEEADVNLVIYYGEEKQRLRCRKYMQMRQITGGFTVEAFDVMALKVSGSRLLECDSEHLSSEDKRVLAQDMNMLTIKLVKEAEDSFDEDSTLTNTTMLFTNSEVRLKPARFLNADVDVVDDDLDTCINQLQMKN
ncbi:unnamed protein product [Bursaphelenchus okinawaensis]|uniref:Cep192-like domain-containing protein n=1 Tax=Bursaphelenchus okinawaensis TaxID=465554 RepID=A0A811JTH2_9BILA|nr:unnamed protein product [Bursaphelenchus okinawaensis]CAG9083020.1 unnamed protein product [Bursaphelenchus okinawaensis]